jgi:hypothetical protein
MSNQTIYMIGDSILDNCVYVPHNCDTVSVLMQKLDEEGFDGVEVQKWAVDGYTTEDVSNQIYKFRRAKMHGFDDSNISKKPNSIGVLSAGGNDALQSRYVLDQYTNKVVDAFSLIERPLSLFRENYSKLLQTMVDGEWERLIVFTVYNKIPQVISIAEKTALALFNDIITEEVAKHKMAGANIDLLDLRVICDEPEDYSYVSPIEPSHQGSQKIVNALINKL